MARPKCSRKEPKRLRSIGEIVRRESISMRAVWSAETVCADSKRPNVELADHAKPTVEACCKNRRRDDMGSAPLFSETRVRIRHSVGVHSSAIAQFSGASRVNAFPKPHQYTTLHS